MSAQTSKSKSIPRAIGLAIVMAAITGAGYVAFVKGPSDIGGNVKEGTIDAVNKTYDLARRIAKDIDSVVHFRPKVTCSGTTVVEASSAIAELSTVEKPFEHTYYFESTWLGSTKRIKLKGQFIAKAGYDLRQPFTIDISDDAQTIRAIMPSPRINSVEQTKVEIVQDEDGWWNKISADERQRALNALIADAKKSLDSTKLLAETGSSFQKQLEEIIRKSAPPTAQIHRVLLP